MQEARQRVLASQLPMPAIQEMLSEIEQIESDTTTDHSKITILNGICRSNRSPDNSTQTKRRLDYLEDLGKRSVDDT